MRHSLTRTVLLASVCIFAHGAIRAWCETNETASGENTNETTWTVSKEGREIEESIAKAPEVILSLTNDVREYTAMICEKIKKSPIPETRYRYFRKLMESACGVDFETIEKNVPEEKEKVEQSRWLSGARYRREATIVDQLGEVYSRLRELAHDISDTHARSSVPVPCAELLDPYFQLIEWLKSGEEWLGKSKSLHFIQKIIPEKIESEAMHIEFRFRRLYSAYSYPLRKLPDPQEFALFKARFEQEVGRPMSSEAECEFNSRRRTDEIIKKQRMETETLLEEREIEEAIAKAPEVILSLTNDVREYTAMICEKIKKSPIPETRYRYFRKLMESACGVDFETIEKNVPEEKVEQPRWFSGPGDRREYEIARQLGELDGQLRELANDISDALALSSVPAPCVELLEPYFKLIERLKAEEQWLGKSKSLCFIKKYIQEKIESVAGHIEFRFRRVYSVYSQPLRTPPDPQDLALFKARFKQVVGRPMRSAEEYRADSRRRMDEIIRRRKEGR